ncbi:MAG: DMT family transporter [Shimia sp.]
MADRPVLGILLMLAFCVLAPIADAIAKHLGTLIPVVTIVVVRFAAQAVLLGPLALVQGRSFSVPPGLRGAVVWRTLLHIVGITLMFTALLYLPLADAIAIAFVMPFLMLLLGWWVLGETVGVQRLVACAGGFVGTLMVVQPSFVEVGWPALLPLGVAVVFALFMLMTRRLAKAVDPIALQAVSGGLAVAIMLPFMAVATVVGWTEFGFVTPPAPAWGWLAASGVAGAVAHLCMTWALRFAPSATLAPMQYLEIPFATFVGYLAFRDLPGGLAAAGIVVTIGAGLYIIERERRAARVPAPPRAAPPAAG